jgi:hypothetical protein
MKKYLHFIIFGTVLLLVKPKGTYAQSSDLVQIQTAIENYNNNYLAEKMYVHTDKSVYLNNELCWFKIYTLDGFFHHPLSLNKVAYVELLDANHQPVMQEKIGLNNASGNGSLQLPANIPTGNYTLVAYTNWMKNFDPSFFFSKSIKVINTQNIATSNNINVKPNYKLSVFPESGNLLMGTENLVGFSIANNYGQPLQSKGWLLNNNGDTICSFQTLMNGIGSFKFTPQAQVAYKAVMETPTGVVEQPLPIPLSNGYTIHIDPSKTDSITVNLHTGITHSVKTFIILHCRGVIKKALQFVINNNQANITLPNNNLGEGINTITLFDADKTPVAERLYFNYPNKQEETITLELNNLNKRQKVNLSINALSNNLYDASMAVYRIDSLQGVDPINIQNYVLLNSDLVGKIEAPNSYFDKLQPNRFLAMDNLMLTQGWRRFTHENIKEDLNKTFTFLPEIGGTIITGKIVAKGTTNPAKETAGFISVPSKNTVFKSAISDDKGKVKFQFDEFTNNGQIIVQADSSNNSKNKIEIDNPFIGRTAKQIEYSPVDVTKMPKNLIANVHQNLQIQNYYTPQNGTQFTSSLQDTNAFYYTPDRTYYLDDYARFTTLEEVIREYVTPVTLVKEKNKYQFFVYDEAYKKFFDETPLVLLDGVIIKDIDKFLEYDPLKIRKLEVVSRVYFSGNMAYNGVINFTTYTGKLEAFELDPNAIVLDYKGLQAKRVFNAPVYDNGLQQESRMPDFRQLLYWNPTLQIEKRKSVQFFTSDVPGNYIISVQGISKDGSLLNQSIPFNVKQ